MFVQGQKGYSYQCETFSFGCKKYGIDVGKEGK